ncbi:exosome RNA helicase MTR4-like [Coccinella septempunctata]|uniref:exosome RNA helicase MTR4-like n=1 Tax=Coccinella septempunctata TaxID=41139 RepID=UPI001D07D1A7|nr:exosome RNA helicase MTR4-like [Coccinella septempunctata]
MTDIDDLFSCFQPSKSEESKEVTPDTENLDERLVQIDLKGVKRESSDDISTSSKKSKHDPNVVDVKDINFEELKNRIVVHTIESIESCSHEVAYPPCQSFIPLLAPTGEPAKTYNFVLDPFQKESILCIDNNQSVLVSAHTSAGKTVIAEYAIATSLKKQQRVIYTTPIKALSNQKYREFMDEFKDVGLVTGDVTINPTASCLIMTTEILRNMLYRGSEIMREVGWVIFDEIHYMRDKERGVVWEETLILLPHNVHFVFLSATIPNARQFIEWVAHLHQQPCHAVYTDYRPTPLQHFVYPAGGTGIHMVVDENGIFKDENFNVAMSVLQDSGDAAKGDQKGRRGGISNKNATECDIFKVLKMIMDRNFAPCIVFSFSKKECELYATQMTKLDFNTAAEKQLIDEVFNNAMNVLSDSDRMLPQVQHLLPLLRRGIGIHHGGLLPILKETIEILFGEGLIKALFATETFAMGLNMPARTVLFTGMRKFDGQQYRWLTSGEYIQMSGRAGRRGLDDKGIVIFMVDEKVPPEGCRDIVKGSPDPINSAFHLTYNMVLNLLRVEEINPEYMLERSFYQFQNQTAIPGLHKEYERRLQEYNNFKIDNEEQIASYYDIRQQLDKLVIDFRKYLTNYESLLPFLQPGRLVKIKTADAEYDWGIVVNYKVTKAQGKRQEKAKCQIDMLLHVTLSSEDDFPKPAVNEEQGEFEVVAVDSKFITHLSSVRLYCPNDLRTKDSRKSVRKSLKEVKKRFPDGPPQLDPVKDMKINDPEFLKIIDKIGSLEKEMKDHPLHETEELNSCYKKYEEKMNIRSKLELAKTKLLEAKSVLQLDELKCRKRVLRRLGYCTNTDVIQLKGRVACELSSADELLLTEMLFSGIFNPLTPAEVCALLSCFVCDEKSNEKDEYPKQLILQMQDIARRIAKISTEARLPLDEQAYIDKFKTSLYHIVHQWCKGASFSDLCRSTEIYEGSIVRCMRRLEELLRQMVQASKTIGNKDLEDKFNEAIKSIKRDIVFSASLYL